MFAHSFLLLMNFNIFGIISSYFCYYIIIVSNRKVSAFSLWYEESKADLMEEHPELSEEDLCQAAAEKFRALSKEEREVRIRLSPFYKLQTKMPK